MSHTRIRKFALFLFLAALLSGCGGTVTMEPRARLAGGLMDEPVDEVDHECSYFYFLWGRTSELDGKYEEAREAYEKSLVCDPGATEVMQRLATLLITMGKKKAAVVWLKKVIAARPEDTASRLVLANLYSSMGDIDKAEEEYGKVIAAEPDNGNVRLMLGSMYARNRRFGDARRVIEEMVERQPDSFLGYHYLARLYQQMGLPGKAAAAYEKALALNFEPSLAFSLARLYEHNRRYTKAEEVYRRVLEKNPVDEKARYLLADLYRRQGRNERALAELEELRTYTGDIRASDLAMARIMIDAKQYDRALAILRRSLADNPSFSEANSLIGAIYHEQKKDGKAIEELEKVRPGSAVYEESVLLGARILEQAGKVDEALDFLERRTRDKKSARKRFFLYQSRLCRMTRRYDRAARIIARAMRFYPDDPDIYFENGLLLDRKGDVDAALKSMARVIELDPRQAYALNYIAYTWVERGENLDKAGEYLKRAMKLQPDDGAIRDSFGWLLYRQGKFVEAARELRKAAQMAPDDPLISEHLGDALVKLGRVRDALKAYRQAVEKTSDKARRMIIEKKISSLRSS